MFPDLGSYHTDDYRAVKTENSNLSFVFCDRKSQLALFCVCVFFFFPHLDLLLLEHLADWWSTDSTLCLLK